MHHLWRLCEANVSAILMTYITNQAPKVSPIMVTCRPGKRSGLMSVIKSALLIASALKQAAARESIKSRDPFKFTKSPLIEIARAIMETPTGAPMAVNEASRK